MTIRRLAVAAVLTLIATAPAAAQNLTLLAGGGATRAAITTDDLNDARYGAVGFVGVGAKLTDLFGLQLRGSYIQKGARGRFTEPEIGAVDIAADVNYLEFHALLRAGGRTAYLLAGASYGYDTTCDVSSSAGGISFAGDCAQFGIEPQADHGVTIGAGADIGSSLFANVLFTEGLSDVIPDEDGSNRTLTIVLGVMFSIGQ